MSNELAAFGVLTKIVVNTRQPFYFQRHNISRDSYNLDCQILVALKEQVFQASYFICF